MRPTGTAAVCLTVLALTLAGCSGAPGESREAGPESPTTSTSEPTAPATSTPTTQTADLLARAVTEGVRRPRTARQAARAVVAAETAIRTPGTPPARLAAAGELAQVAYRVIGTHPSWDEPVLAAVPTGLRRAVRLNVAARRDFRSMHSTLSDTLPAWRIVRPEPVDDLVTYYLEAERRFGVDWEYLAAINLVETGMGRIRGFSVAGAQGPMQFIPSTWEAYGSGDINDPRDSILSAARYLRARGFTEPDGVAGALYGYNNHPAYVRGVTALATVLQDDPRAYLGYYHWQVYYLSSVGDVVLRPGYESRRSIAVRRYLRDNPEAAST